MLKDRALRPRSFPTFLAIFSFLSIFFYLFMVAQDKGDVTSSTFNPLEAAARVAQTKYNLDPSVQVIVAFSEDLEPHVKAKKCSVGPIEHITWDTPVWQRVEYENVYLFSAYYDDRYAFRGHSYHFIRIISIVRESIQNDLTCYLWSNGSNVTAETVPVTATELWLDFWSKGSSVPLYKSFLLSCHVPESLRYNVTAISISANKCSKPETYVPVSQSPSPSSSSLSSPSPSSSTSKSFQTQIQTQRDFVVCLKALDFARDISLRLIEWLEVQFILGADIVYIYIYRVHSATMKVLRYYESLGKVKVVLLDLPGQLPNELEERSQFMKNNIWQKRRLELVPYNDCLYRHIYTHKFLVVIDIDEVIVPVKDYTWKALLDRLFEYDPNAISIYPSFSAQNTYFIETLPVPPDPKIPDYLYMLRHVGRTSNFSIPGYAVKSFMSTNTSLAVFNHYTLFPLYPTMKRNALISTSLAQLNHYKSECPRTMVKECAERFMKFWKVDKVLLKYRKPLINSINKVISELGISKDSNQIFPK